MDYGLEFYMPVMLNLECLVYMIRHPRLKNQRLIAGFFVTQ